jgi:hypothetical protein
VKVDCSSELFIDIGSSYEDDSSTEGEEGAPQQRQQQQQQQQIIPTSTTNELERIGETSNDYNILFTCSADSDSPPRRSRDKHTHQVNSNRQQQEQQQQSTKKTAALTELYMDIIEEHQTPTTPNGTQKSGITNNPSNSVETPTPVPLSAEWLQEWLSANDTHEEATEEVKIKPTNMENTLFMEEASRTVPSSTESPESPAFYEVVVMEHKLSPTSKQPQSSILDQVLASTLTTTTTTTTTTSTPPPTRSILKTGNSCRSKTSSSFRKNDNHHPKSNTPDTLPITPDSVTELDRRTKITGKDKRNSPTKQSKQEETRKVLVSSFSDAIIGNTSNLYATTSSATSASSPAKTVVRSTLPSPTSPNRSITLENPPKQPWTDTSDIHSSSPEQQPRDRIRAVGDADQKDENDLAQIVEIPRNQSPKYKKDAKNPSMMSGYSTFISEKPVTLPSKSSIRNTTTREKTSESKLGNNNQLVFSGLGHRFAPDGSSVVSMVESKRRSWCEQQIQATQRELEHYNKWLQDNVREVVRLENTVRSTYQALEDYAKAMEAICEDIYVGNDGNLLTQKEKINLEKNRSLSSTELSIKSSPLLAPVVESYTKLKNELRTYVPLLADDLREASSLRELISASANDIEEKLNAVGLEKVQKAEENVQNAAAVLIKAVKWHENTENRSSTIAPGSFDVLDRWLLEAQYRNAAHVGVLIWKENRRKLQAIYKEIVELDMERSRRMRQLLLSFLPKRRKFMESAHSSLLPGAQDLAKAKIDSQKESEAIEKTIEAIAMTAIQNCGDVSALADEGDFEAPGSEWNSPFVKETFIFNFKVDLEWKLSVAVVTVDDFLHIFVLTDEDLCILGDKSFSVEEALPCVKMSSPTVSISLEECEVDFLVDSMTEMELRRSVRSKLPFRKQSDQQLFIKFKDREEAAEKFAYLRSVGKKKSPQSGEDDL